MKNIRKSQLEIDSSEFKIIAAEVVETIVNLIKNIRDMPVTVGDLQLEIKNAIHAELLPENGINERTLFQHTSDLLVKYSLFNSHPKFLGYISGAPAPIGILADFLASAINPNVGANILSPIATEIEKQTIRWLTELIGLPNTHGGILVSGGNMANFIGFLAGRNALLGPNFKKKGVSGNFNKSRIYCSNSTHTWVEKAVTLFGHGKESLRWIKTTSSNQMDIAALEENIESDLKKGLNPMMIVATAGDVSTGSVDRLDLIGQVAAKYNLWFHVDGAYGVPAAAIDKFRPMFNGLDYADSIAIDPHKWLYAPMEVGCTLVKCPNNLQDTFSTNPAYYNFSSGEESVHNFYEYGMQNSRGFRALKVWMTLKHIGKRGIIKSIQEDIELSKLLYERAKEHNELEAISNSLSITTFRYNPLDNASNTLDEIYLNTLNRKLLNKLQKSGEVFLSNAIIDNKYCLRGCIVNFRTSEQDIEEIIDIVIREGRKLYYQNQIDSKIDLQTANEQPV